jgi:hypothetical protein
LTVNILVSATLPRTVRVGEIDIDAKRFSDEAVLRKLATIVESYSVGYVGFQFCDDSFGCQQGCFLV